MSYLGIDIGMTGAKALVVSETGRVLKRRYTDYGSDYKKNIQTRISPANVWAGVCKVIRGCRCDSLKEPLKCISVSVSGDDFFPADSKGRPLADVISAYQDTGKEYEEFIIKQGGGEKRLFEITGQPVRGNVYPLHRMLWIKDNQPEIYNRTWQFLGWEEYINLLLTGECVSDYSLVSRTLLFDINRKKWSRHLTGKMGIECEKLPKVEAPGKVIGKVRKKIARELDLPTNCLVATGGFDQATASLGAGVTGESVSSLSLGTVIAGHWLIEKRNGIRSRDYSYCCSLAGDNYMGLFFSFNGCAVLNWFFREFSGPCRRGDKQNDKYDYYNSRIVSGKPSGLFVLPHLAGAPQPYTDDDSRGAILGIRLDTSAADVLKAIYEGIAFDLKMNYQQLEADNISIKGIRASGGGSRSDAWMQILANVLGYEISTLKADEGSSMAAALLAATAAGDFNSVAEAADSWVKDKKTVQPDHDSVKQFDEKYQKYLRLHRNVKSFNKYLGRYDD